MFNATLHRFAITCIMLMECMGFCPVQHAHDEATMHYCDELDAEYRDYQLSQPDQGDEDRHADYHYEPQY